MRGSSLGIVMSVGASCVVAACGPSRPESPIGVSTARRYSEATPHAEHDGGVKLPAAIPADFRTAFTKVNRARFVSRGHFYDRFTADVYVNPVGLPSYEARGGAIPVGSVLVKEHFERGDAPGPVMLMEKRPPGYDPAHGDWRYVVAGANGQLLIDGPNESCIGCHADAPRDHVFPIAE
jgi:hypothetical protein